MRPGICTVQRHINGNISHNPDLFLIGISLERLPLAGKQKLLKFVKKDFIRIPLTIAGQFFRFPQFYLLIPQYPAYTAKRIFYRHIQRIVLQPIGVFLTKCLELRMIRNMAVFICFAQNLKTGTIHFFIIHPRLITAKITGFTVLPGKPAFLHQCF